MIVINITDKDLGYAKCASIKTVLFFYWQKHKQAMLVSVIK